MPGHRSASKLQNQSKDTWLLQQKFDQKPAACIHVPVPVKSCAATEDNANNPPCPTEIPNPPSAAKKNKCKPRKDAQVCLWMCSPLHVEGHLSVSVWERFIGTRSHQHFSHLCMLVHYSVVKSCVASHVLHIHVALHIQPGIVSGFNHKCTQHIPSFRQFSVVSSDSGSKAERRAQSRA